MKMNFHLPLLSPFAIFAETFLSMQTVNQYLRLVEDGLGALRFPGTPAGLYQPIEYTLDGGGKRLRPVLTLAVADALGLNPSLALNQALGIEMFHNFTLLHDDVMDKADTRRRRPTVHVKWNENTAILSGDAMFTMATSLVVENSGDRLPEVLSMFNTTAMQIYEGQQFDMDFETRSDVTVKEYLDMIYLKTAVLMGAACAIGVIMARGDEKAMHGFYDYATDMGLAFQLRDDLLDTFGDPAVFGKKIGGDILNNKKTWLLVNAMENPALLPWLEASPSQEKIDAVTKIYREMELDKKCAALVDDYASKALRHLGELDLSPEASTFFTDLVNDLSYRKQ